MKNIIKTYFDSIDLIQTLNNHYTINIVSGLGNDKDVDEYIVSIKGFPEFINIRVTKKHIKMKITFTYSKRSNDEFKNSMSHLFTKDNFKISRGKTNRIMIGEEFTKEFSKVDNFQLFFGKYVLDSFS